MVKHFKKEAYSKATIQVNRFVFLKNESPVFMPGSRLEIVLLCCLV
jgi:hypothetical protein